MQVYTVSGVKSFRGMEGVGFNANLLENGRKVCFVMDAAQGGCYDYEWYDKEAEKRFEAHVKSLPPRKAEGELAEILKARGEGPFMAVDSDGVVCDLVTAEEERRTIKRLIKTRLVFSLTDGGLLSLNRPYSPERAEALRKEYGPRLAKIWGPGRGSGGRMKVPRVEVNVPDGVSGEWSVKSFTVDPQGASFHNVREAIHGTARGIVPGMYKRLLHNGETVMSNTPAEIGDLMPLLERARGRVLLNGLGLGVALKMVLEKRTSQPNHLNKGMAVQEVLVVELSEDVIKLVAPSFAGDPRVTIHHGDAFKFPVPRGARFDAVWHDIWPAICRDNLPEMAVLHMKYRSVAAWQGSWCKEECRFGR